LIVRKARQLRKNLTEAERKLWRVFRNRHFSECKFRRQEPIGKYIVDFICLEKKLIIEVDGGQHADQSVYDTKRTGWLSSHGFKILE
jgi:very-short-patch-repair endonuclease